MNITRDEFLDKYLAALRDDNAAVLVGAGLSKAAGYVDWSGLLDPIATPLGLDAKKETDLVGLAQFHLNANAGNRHELNQLLINQFADIRDPSENHRILARLPLWSIWTTNYDRLIERALEDSGKRVDAKYDVAHLATARRGRDAVVYKMHGDIEHPDKAVLTRDDYELYASSHAPFLTALMGDLVERSFLFLGFSFTDPNLDHVLARIRTRFDKQQRQHYCIMKARSQQKDESEEDFLYAKTRQDHVVRDLLRFNIKTLLVDSFEEITEILGTLANRFRMRTLFVSGAAADFGTWGQTATEDFVRRLAAVLVKNDCRIGTGFGLGIGGPLVTGAVQQIYSSSSQMVDDHLLLRPFPIGIPDEEERMRVFSRYREELIAQAGIAIFLMGNKQSDGKIVPSDGMRAEYQIARDKGVHCLPIGASGGVAAEIWTDVNGEFDVRFPGKDSDFRAAFERLGAETANPLELLEPLLYLIDNLRKD